jgi:type III restriction enzyme
MNEPRALALAGEATARRGIIAAKEVHTMATETTKKSWVQKTPGVCGGDACIRNTRITVHGLVHYRQLGFSDERLLEMIQGLTPDDLAAAWEYGADHAAEIEEAIRLNEEA